MKQHLKRDDIQVLSVDDVNLRKGNASTACSVFIDGDSHRVLVIVEGATKAVSEKVMQQFPAIHTISRDRDTAYASAAKACEKTQVADRFHLIQNLHKAVKDALYQEMRQDVFLYEGEGWIWSADEEALPDPGDKKVDPHDHKAITRPPNDLEERIRLAGLTKRQGDKYQKTMAALALTEEGKRIPEIARGLAMTRQQVGIYRKQAPETIQNVETKIDAYYEMHARGQREGHQKTLGQKPRPSSESIVAPYQETVGKMFREGYNHRQIHPVIQQEGFEGSANAVYQYLLKYAYEEGIPYGNKRVIPADECHTDSLPPRPETMTIERTTRTAVYRHLLHNVAKEKETSASASTSLAAEDRTQEKKNETHASEEEIWENLTHYSDEVAKLVLDREPKPTTSQKKWSQEAWERLENRYDLIPYLFSFLQSFRRVVSHNDTEMLEEWIQSYENDAIEALRTFARGIKKDQEAVSNGLKHPEISNGPMEGTNNKIKMVRRRGYGRAGVELLNALVVLPWYYKDRNQKEGDSEQSSTAA